MFRLIKGLRGLYKVPYTRRFAILVKYTKEHEWIRFDTETKEGLIGITDFAQSQLGDIVHITLPDSGSFNHGDSLGSIESVKMVADIYSPTTGTITKVNDLVRQDPSLINKSAEKEWLNGILVKDEKEIDQLLTKEQYEEFLKTLKHN